MKDKLEFSIKFFVGNVKIVPHFLDKNLSKKSPGPGLRSLSKILEIYYHYLLANQTSVCYSDSEYGEYIMTRGGAGGGFNLLILPRPNPKIIFT